MEAIKKIENSKLLKIFLVTLLGTLLLTISAKIKVPFYPVPATMQTFVVLFIGISFGHKVGIATVALYLFEGIIGLPVFANSPEKGVGLIYFTGPTMGYLIGFLFSVYIAGLFKYDDCFHSIKFKTEYSFKEKIIKTILNILNNCLKNLLKLTFCVSFIYICGLIWLGYLIGWDKPVFKLGAAPFLLPELQKILILSIIAGSLKKLKKVI